MDLRTIIETKGESVDLIPLFFQINDDDIYIEEIDGLGKPIGSGVSTIVFDKGDDKVLCISVDYAKVLYLKKEKAIKEFKFIRFLEFSHGDEVFTALIYEMEKLEKISKDDKDMTKIISELSFLEDIGLDKEYISEDHANVLEGLSIDMDFYLVNDILEKHDARLDFHVGQFMLDKQRNIICVDPLIGNNIYF